MSFYLPRRRPTQPKEPPARPLLVGSSIDATCRKCKARTEHTVVAKVGVKPTRVECSVCKETHDYAAPPARRTAARPAVAPTWAELLLATSGAATPYSVSGTYRVGTRVAHASFGEGVVLRHSSPTVCEVLFESRTVKLLMARTVSDVRLPEPGAARVRAGRGRRFG